MIPIDWDSRTPAAAVPGFRLTLKTGVTQGLQNTLTLLTMPVPMTDLPARYRTTIKRPAFTGNPFDVNEQTAYVDEARHIVRDLEGLQGELAKLDRPVYDPVPELVVYSRETWRGLLEIVCIWGMVLTGAASKGDRIGEWVFLVCRLDELETVLTDVFKLESWFEQDAPKAQPVKPSAKAKRPAVVSVDEADARRKIEATLKEMRAG